MHMVSRQDSIHNLNAHLISRLRNDFANTDTQAALKHFIAVLSYPNDMIAMMENSMAGLVIFRHDQVSGARKRAFRLRIPDHDLGKNIGLKSFSPKGEGFNQEE